MKHFYKLATTLIGCMLLATSAFAAGPFEEGTHYKRLSDPVPVRSKDAIEVAEIFSYACGHCYNFEPLLQRWKEQLPDDVQVVKLHVKWDRTTENLARALYTAQALEVMDTVHPALFRAIHAERKRLQNQEQIADIFTGQGVDEEVFNKTFDSFGITSQVSQGQAKVAGSQVRGTPSMLVNGEYVIEPGAGVDHETMLEIADFLIEKIRKDRGDA
ncbi:thiol:disulfide interchange protein DsbA/DsbL [Gilvimarinus sp. F26214L]|uniref:thiol:disulfide interchange protein DsbA/DsbL n=1 Tax=Gilvimarinus sp. DZF01 TaxID=3461371 RepID=UPI0040463852